MREPRESREAANTSREAASRLRGVRRFAALSCGKNQEKPLLWDQGGQGCAMTVPKAIVGVVQKFIFDRLVQSLEDL